MSTTNRDRALVTGIAGFTGPHLVKLLLAQGLDVFGLDRAVPDQVRLNLGDTVHLICGDLLDKDAVSEIVHEIRPAYIFHLASMNRPDDLMQLLANNVLATDHLLRAAAQGAADMPTRFFIPGSAAEYGMVQPGDLPIGEEQPLRPVSLYGVSKAAQFLLAQSYYLRSGLEVFGSRAFNLIGPGEQPSMVCSAIAHQIAAAERGFQDPVIEVGNLSSERDFVDIRDAVRAYWTIITHGRPGQVYNICSGTATCIQNISDMLLHLADIPLTVRVDPRRLRRDDVPRSVGNHQKLSEQTGWQPGISLAESLTDVLNYWREQYAADSLSHP
jgi:GDP-4-dehydro-6-deoxy-D-mannose reductase